MKTMMLAASLAVMATPALAGWVSNEIKTPIDGRAGVKVHMSGIAILGNGKTVPAHLVIRCLQKSTDAYVYADRQSMPFDARMNFAYHTDTAVRYKVNDAPIAKGNWNASLDNDAVGLWRGAAIPWLKVLAKADKGEAVKLTIEARGMRGDSSYQFDVAGIKEALAPIAKECGWAP